MNARELVATIFAASPIAPLKRTCDGVIAGDPEREIKKIAVTMMPTARVLRMAVDWNADILITHEPLYGESPEPQNDPVYEAKAKLIANASLVVCRYHDYCHHRAPDLIAAGEINYLGLGGRIHNHAYPVNRITIDQPLTARQMATNMTEKLGISHPRIVGQADCPMTKISLCFGQTGQVWKELQDENVEMVLAGELSEWLDCEYARDAAFFGYKKAVVIMGHVGSERDGMKLLKDELKRLYPALEIRYFDCEEVYQTL